MNLCLHDRRKYTFDLFDYSSQQKCNYEVKRLKNELTSTRCTEF